jgi:hypothetical protein
MDSFLNLKEVNRCEVIFWSSWVLERGEGLHVHRYSKFTQFRPLMFAIGDAG